MENDPKVKAFSKLHSLLNYYSEYRDRPVKEGFDFFQEVQSNCEILGLDFEEFKKEFELTK